MAQLIPSDIARSTLSGVHQPELDTLWHLKSALPSHYTVFHSVHWSREQTQSMAYGEIDFIIVSTAGKVLLIEQKNGRLEETDAGLFKRYAGGGKSVVHQIHRSLDQVREQYRQQHRADTLLPLDYLLYCPDYGIQRLNAVGLDPSRVVDASAKDALSDRIQRLIGPAGERVHPRYDQLLDFFQQSFEVVPDIHARLHTHEDRFIRLNHGLIEVIHNLEMTPWRLRVMGTPGCGKSLVAQQTFNRMIEQGKRPLLVCFNRLLSEQLKPHCRPGGYLSTWYGLCDTFLRARGHQIDFQAMETDSQFWPRLQEQILGESIPEDWLFDALIVDEGQDFAPEWVDILQLFLRDDAAILWLEDTEQNLRRQEPVELSGFVSYRTRSNFRSPYSIAHFIKHTLPFSFTCANSLPGLGVGVTGYRDPAEQPSVVEGLVEERLAEGFALDDIVILSCQGASKSAFSAFSHVGRYPLRRFTGRYDPSGHQVFTGGRLRFESIHRFKGQQAPAIILVDIEPSASSVADQVLFCGMTRATLRLDLLVNHQHPKAKRFAAVADKYRVV